MAQNPSGSASACAEITAPLTAEEQAYARTAWQYFVANYQPATGFVNSTGGYPSGTLWDMANYLMALNAVRWMNIIEQKEFDNRLNKFLSTLSGLKLFEDTLPNKVYNAASGEMTDYGNNPKPRGIGWSALDIGRMLAAFHIIRTCHPQYADWVKGILAKWNLAKSIKDEQLYGALVLPDDKTLLVQEGRLGYEEYAARGYELWGFKPSKAIAIEPFQFVKINNLNIPVDTRDYQSTNANNYVVSESYILDAIEFGLQGYLQDYTASVFEVQKREYEKTGELKSVSEDNIDQAPYFLYNTVYSNGVSWATITEENKPYPQLRTLSTKAAFGWRYLYPNDPYAQKLFDVAKDLRSPDGNGFYAGLYQETKQPNKSLTGNTNGLILEILYFKARGNRPLISSNQVTFASAQPTGNSIATGSPTNSTATAPPASQPAPQPVATAPPASQPAPQPVATAPANAPSTPAPRPAPQGVAVAPIPSVGNPNRSSGPEIVRPLKVQERRYAEAAWNYFKANFQSNTGLVSDRNGFKAVTPWGIGDYLAALHAARSLGILPPDEFDQRTRLLLGALAKLPLATGELPSRSYDTRSLQPVDYGGNPVPQGTGWSSLDIGRLLAALYNLKSCYPQYTDAVDNIVLDWSYLRVVRDNKILSAFVTKDDSGRVSASGLTPTQTLVKPETRLGYEEYAARAFQLWGFEVERSAVGGQYKTASVDGVDVPTRRLRPDVKTEANKYIVSDPFMLYGLEFGFDPQMLELVDPIRRVQVDRYRRTGTLTASGTTVADRPPYVVHSTVIAEQQPWATLGDDGKSAPDSRMVSTATVFAYRSLFPNDAYANDLWEATLDLYNPSLGYYEGFYEKTGKPAMVFTSSTNSMVLQALLYMVTNRQPLVRPTTAMNSPWWRAVAKGDSGRGLPNTATQKARFISDATRTYWVSDSNNSTTVTLQRSDGSAGDY
ncbi:MAG TPA: DUF3131 domain-containing protein [Candidatus Obscuribacterales bacterium]